MCPEFTTTPRKFSVLASGTALLFSNMTFVALSIAAGILLARWLGTAGRGVVTLYVTIPQTLFNFSHLGFGSAAVYMISRKIYTPRQVLRTGLGFGLLGSAVATVVLFIICPPTSDYWKGIPLWAMLLTPLLTWAIFAHQLARRVHVALSHVHYATYSHIAQGIVRIVLIVLLVLALQWGLCGAILAAASELVVGAIVAVGLTAAYLRLEIGLDFSVLRRCLQYGIQSWIFMFLSGTNLILGIYFVNYFMGKDAVGLFGTGRSLCLALQMVSSAWTFVLLPLVAGSDSAHLSRRTLQIARNGVFILVVLGCVLAAVAPWIVPLLYGRAFSRSVNVIWATVPGVIFAHPYRTFAIDFTGRGRQIMPIVCAGVGALVNAGCCRILIPMKVWYGGIVGAGLSMSASALVMMIILTGLFRHHWHTPLRQMFVLTHDDFQGYRNKIRGVMYRWRTRRKGVAENYPSDDGDWPRRT